MGFPNPRIHTTPAERMRGTCLFCERFISRDTFQDNGNTPTDGALGDSIISRGLTLRTNADNNNMVMPHSFTFTKMSMAVSFSVNGYDNFSFGFAATNGSDFLSTYMVDHPSQGPVWVSVLDNVGYLPLGMIKCPDIADGNVHHALVTIDTEASTMILRLDDYEPLTGNITQDVSAGIPFSGTNVYSEKTTGTDAHYTVFKMAVFDYLMTEDDFNHFRNQDTTEFVERDLFALWRCNQHSDDEDSNYIWDKLKSKPLTKGDGSTVGTFPVFTLSDKDDFYDFTGSKYVNALSQLTLPESFTVSACTSDTQTDGRFPSVTQEDSATTILQSMGSGQTFIDDNLHSLFISTRELTEMEKIYLKYAQLKDCHRAGISGAISELISEGICRVALVFNTPTQTRDIAFDTPRQAVFTDVTEDGAADTVTYTGASSRVTMAHQSGDEDCRRITVIMFGAFPHYTSAKYLFSKGSLSFAVGASQLQMNGTSGSPADSRISDGTARMVAVSAASGKKPRFFVDESFIGEGGANVTLPSSNTDDFVFGNDSTFGYAIEGAVIQACLVFNDTLTDQEIDAVYNCLASSFSKPEVYEVPEEPTSWPVTTMAWSLTGDVGGSGQIFDFCVHDSTLYVSTNVGTYRYNEGTDTWSIIDAATVTAGGTMESVGGVLYQCVVSGNVYYLNEVTDTWVSTGATTPRMIAALGDTLYMVADTAGLFYYNGSSWVSLSQMTGKSFRSISVFDDKIWFGCSDGTVFYYTGTGSAVNTSKPGTGGVYGIGGHDGFIYASSTSGALYKYDISGASWSDISGEMSNQYDFRAMKSIWGNLVAGGISTYPEYSDNNIRRYNSTDGWVSFWGSSGNENRIYAIELFNGKIYAGVDATTIYKNVYVYKEV